MQEERLNELIVIAGGKGAGKTWTCRELVKAIDKKLLIIDTTDHPAWRHLETVDVDYLKHWKSGDIRIIHDDPLEISLEISKRAYNCVIVYEDAMNYTDSNIPRTFRRVIGHSKQHNCDVIMMYHYLSQIPKLIRMLTDTIILHKTKDKLSACKSFSNEVEIEEAFKRVKAHAWAHYCEAISDDI